jgi:hypothetical protein
VQGARWSDAATLGTATSATPALAGTVGLGVQYLDWGARAARLPDAARDATGALGTRGPVPAASLAASVAYARPLLGLRAGVAVKALEERLGATRDHALAVDVGVAKGFLFDNVVLALAAQNLGRGLDLAGGRAALPSRVTVGIAGAGYPLRSWLDVGVSYALSVLRGGGVVTGGGVEAALVPLDGYAIALRTGVRRTPDPRERPVTAGLGLTRDRLSLDYAYEPLAGQDAHRVGVRLR